LFASCLSAAGFACLDSLADLESAIFFSGVLGACFGAGAVFTGDFEVAFCLTGDSVFTAADLTVGAAGLAGDLSAILADLRGSTLTGDLDLAGEAYFGGACLTGDAL